MWSILVCCVYFKATHDGSTCYLLLPFCIYSWGDYWGEMGFFRIILGKNALGIETQTAWATPLAYSVENFPCVEDASNCAGGINVRSEYYVDPSENGVALGELLSRPL